MTVPAWADDAQFHAPETPPRVARARVASPPEPDWTGAICAQVDPELWFPEKGGTSLPSRRLCMTCPLRVTCLEYALSFDINPHGVWGGTTVQERRKLREKRTTPPTRRLNPQANVPQHDRVALLERYDALPERDRKSYVKAGKALGVNPAAVSLAVRERQQAS